MSGILRNTLRIVGTGKYAPNYLKTNKCNNNVLALHQPNFNNLAPKLQFNEASHFGTTVQAVGKKILSILGVGENTITSNIDRLKVEVYSGKIRLYTPEKTKKLTFTPTLSIQLNGHPIKPHGNEIPNGKKTFQMGKWNVTLDDDKLIFKVNDTNETFILKHAIHMKAHKSPPILLEDGSVKQYSRTTISDVSGYPNKLISKVEGLEPLERSCMPKQNNITGKRLNSYGRDPPDVLIGDGIGEITDKPNEFGRMKLKFPMTASLEGAQQKIKINDMDDDYLIVYHNVDIETSKKLAINETAHTKKNSTSKIGVLEMELESGRIIIEPRASDDQRVTIIHEVNIQIDLDSEIPNIYISPVVKGHICLE